MSNKPDDPINEVVIGPLPPSAEHLIREALNKLRASRNHFKSKQVAEARELLELCLREHGQLAWPPVRLTRNGKSITDGHTP